LGDLRYKSHGYEPGQRNSERRKRSSERLRPDGLWWPLPPPGRPHHYRFRLLALDVARLDIRPHAKCQDVQHAAEGHKLAEATLVGMYAR
jgi:phosphatidylethanolamine-binding protein (PEBP) family uncharacterized protein